LRRDKDNFSALRDRSKKHIVNGPYKLRPPVKISTKTIDTDTIGRLNKANQRMSQFLYNLANEPSVGLYHVNDHIRRTVPRLVTSRQEIHHHKVEMDKTSCDIEEILPTVRTIGSLTAFKSMQSLLQKSIQLASPKPASASSSTSSRSLGPPSPNRSPASTSPNTSMRQIDTSYLTTMNTASPATRSNPTSQRLTLEPPVTSSGHDSTATTQSEITALSIPIVPSESLSAPDQAQEGPEPTAMATLDSNTSHTTQLRSEDVGFESALDIDRPVLNPFGDQTEDIVEVDISAAGTPLLQEELILGNRAPSSTKKKKRQGHQDDSLVPKAF
jgi:hypothetical protein